MKSFKLIKNGRPIIYNPSHDRAFKSGTLKGYVYEHICVAEKKLGRKLNVSEVVHHIDGDKTNNDISNIIVFKSNSDHSRFHKGNLNNENICTNENSDYSIDYSKSLSYVKTEDNEYKLKHSYICSNCGRMFETFEKRRLSRKHYFCSQQCSMEFSKRNQPSKEQLISDLIVLKSYRAVSKKYNVSDVTIKKWINNL